MVMQQPSSRLCAMPRLQSEELASLARWHPVTAGGEFDAGVCASDPSWFARIAVYRQFAAVAVIAATCTLEAAQRFFCLQERMPVLSYRLQPVLWHFWGVQCVGMGRNALKRSTPGRKKKSTKDSTSFKELSINMQRYTNPGFAWRCHHPQIHSTNAWLVVI